MKYLLLFLGIFGILTASFAQNYAGPISIQGIVLKSDSLQPIVNVNIYLKSSLKGVRSDENGLFLLEAQRTDTIVFSSVGYQTTFYILSDTLTSNSYSIIQHMPVNQVKLETVEITSWPSLEQFNQVFTNEFGYDENMAVAKKNVNPSLQSIDMNKVNLDAQGNYLLEGSRYQNRYSYVYENAHIPVNNLLNPKRWNKLVKDIKKGSY